VASSTQGFSPDVRPQVVPIGLRAGVSVIFFGAAEGLEERVILISSAA